MTTTSPAPAPTVLQRLVLPDPAICGESDIYLHRTERVTLDQDELAFLEGGTVWTDTYMNLVNLGTWTRGCRLEGLTLRLAGSGSFALQIWRQRTPSEVDVLVEEIVTLDPAGTEVALGPQLGAEGPDGALPPQDGLIMMRLVAQERGRITTGEWVTRTPDPTEVRLAVAITTFRRERQVAHTAARMAAFLDAMEGSLGAEVSLFVVDNGDSAEIAPHPRVTRVANPNLGGAGGFARGLTLAQDGGFTHCLFMDDDASFQMENLVRTLAYLRLARSPRAAVSGAMISEARKWVMWENGSVFRGMCQPQHVGTDLRNAHAVARMEIEAARPKPEGFYAGWWFFAFPVAAATRFPFPFFVRGDDISFSLAHDFDTATLSGVVSFQEDFSAKESPLTLYLDLRNHLHQHLVHPGLEIGWAGTARIAAHFLLRSIVRMHYDSAEAQLAAWEDVMRGPDFFEQNADMSRRRPEIAAFARTEAWREVPPMAPEAAPRQPPGQLRTQALKWTLNGHLLPGYTLFAGDTRIPAVDRGLIWPLWGMRSARFYDGTGTRGYEVRHDKRRFWQISLRALGLLRRWRQAYPALRDAHRAGYARMTARPFWETQFATLPAAAARTAPATLAAPERTEAAAAE